jgi:hypothetical protein
MQPNPAGVLREGSSEESGSREERMMTNELGSPVDIERMHSRLFNLGLLMNLLAPAVIIFVGVFVRASFVDERLGVDLSIFFWVLLAVALSEIPVIYLMKRKLLLGNKDAGQGGKSTTTEQALLQWGIITYSLALAPSIYGLVYHIMGGSFERFVLFAAITLFCFLLFKPKQEEISSFVKRRSDSVEPAEEL